jgi:Tol biopolymer transport system component
MVVVQYHLWDVISGEHLISAQYGMQPENWHRIAHVIAEAIVERLTGRT